MHLKVVLPVLFLLSFSFIYAFADPGSLSVQLGNSYQIFYNAIGAKVLSVQPNTSDGGLVFSTQVNNPAATLQVTLPRALIDDKQNGKDATFLVVADGALISYQENNSTDTARTLLMQLSPGTSEVEIIGTYLAAQGSVSTPPVNIQNQTTKSTQIIPPVQNQSKNTPIQNTTQQVTPTEKVQNTISQSKTASTQISLKSLKSLLQNLPIHLHKQQIIEYAIIASAILIFIIVVTSLKSSKNKKVLRKP